MSLVSSDATAHEDSVLSVDVDDVDGAYALAQATGLLPDYDKCQAYTADVQQRLPFRKLIALPSDAGRACRPHDIGLGGRLRAQARGDG